MATVRTRVKVGAFVMVLRRYDRAPLIGRRRAYAQENARRPATTAVLDTRRTRDETMFRAIAILTMLLVVGACAPASGTSTDGRATVAHVIDGDTIVVSINGQEEHVRLIGI